MIFDNVVAELVEEDVSSVVFVNGVKNGMGIRHVHALLLQQGHCLHELCLRHPPVPAGVDLVEDVPVVGVLSEVLEQIFELGFGDVVVAVFGGCLQNCFGGVEGPDDDWFEGGQFGDLDDIVESLVDLGQTEVAVVVDIEVGPVLLGLGWVKAQVQGSNLALMISSL